MAKERLKSPRARLFVALELPGEVREAIVAWQGRELTDPALRPVRPESLHITLVFLGYRAEKDLDRIAAAALAPDAPDAPDAPEAPEVGLEREPVGVPKGKRPRLLALDAPSPGAVALQGRVEERLVAARFHEAEKRPFWPHLTVARVRPERRGSRKPAEVGRWPGSLPEHTFPSFRPTRLVLFRSHLRRSGAEYEPMAALALRSPADR